MKTPTKHLFLLLTLIAGLGLILAAPARAQYIFAPEIQSTNTASITYNSATGTFQYTDANNLSADFAGLPLAGNAAAFITASNGWAASLTANLSTRSMPGGGPYAAMGLSIVINTNDYNIVEIALGQVNYTGIGGGNFYGTEVYFRALTNGLDLQTTPLGGSTNNGGASLRVLSSYGSSSSPVTESISGVSGVLALTNDAATDTLTGYYNGSPVGSISLASWGPHPSLTLAVSGLSADGITIPAGTVTASKFYAAPVSPQLTLIHAGVNVILTWLTNAVGFTLQSTTNLVSTNWSTVSPAPVVVNGQNTVTNSISGTRRFYRLSQ